MFTRAFRLLKNFKPLLAASLLTAGFGFKKVFLDQKLQINVPLQTPTNEISQHPLRKLIEIQVCDSKSIRQGQLFFVQVTEQSIGDYIPKKYKILISRIKGKLYAVVGHCPYKQPLSNQTTQSNSMEDAISFNQKLYCPHHGCAFDLCTGTVQYGPAKDNLAKVFVSEANGRVSIAYPTIIPTSVQPQMQFRDFNDLRKVIIIGGDHNATMGVLQGLKLYGYGGELTIVDSTGDMSYPYRDDLLHKKLLNVKKDNKKSYSQKQLQKIFEQSIYEKLNFHPELWYKQFGIDLLFTNEVFRIFNKKYFPYIKFADGAKVQFDGIVYCTGFKPKFPYIRNITSSTSERQYDIGFVIGDKLNLPPNIFAPFYNKTQHRRMLKFLNTKKIDNMIVMGMNVQSLQFIQALKNQFPQINVKIIDMNKQNTLTQMLGPQIGRQIVRQYTKRGVQMYIKVQDMPQFINKYTQKNIQQKSIFKKTLQPQNSIKVTIDQENVLNADCMVLFPNNTIGNSDKIKTAKFVDLDFNKINDRVVTDPNCRTDTKRMFAAGSGTSMEFFFTRDRIQLINPNVSHEQGLTSGFNLDAKNVPFHYIPFQKHQFFGKKLLYAGARKPFNQMYVIGDIKQWDFVAFYALQDDLIAVCATPSRQKQFQVMRESFRLQCSPQLKDLVTGKWDIPNIYKLIRRLNKSGCYKQLIHQLHAQMNIPDVIWMDREKGSNINDDDDQTTTQYDTRGYEKQT